MRGEESGGKGIEHRGCESSEERGRSVWWIAGYWLDGWVAFSYGDHGASCLRTSPCIVDNTAGPTCTARSLHDTANPS